MTIVSLSQSAITISNCFQLNRLLTQTHLVDHSTFKFVRYALFLGYGNKKNKKPYYERGLSNNKVFFFCLDDHFSTRNSKRINSTSRHMDQNCILKTSICFDVILTKKLILSCSTVCALCKFTEKSRNLKKIK